MLMKYNVNKMTDKDDLRQNNFAQFHTLKILSENKLWNLVWGHWYLYFDLISITKVHVIRTAVKGHTDTPCPCQCKMTDCKYLVYQQTDRWKSWFNLTLLNLIAVVIYEGQIITCHQVSVSNSLLKQNLYITNRREWSV